MLAGFLQGLPGCGTASGERPAAPATRTRARQSDGLRQGALLRGGSLCCAEGAGGEPIGPGGAVRSAIWRQHPVVSVYPDGKMYPVRRPPPPDANPCRANVHAPQGFSLDRAGNTRYTWSTSRRFLLPTCLQERGPCKDALPSSSGDSSACCCRFSAALLRQGQPGRMESRPARPRALSPGSRPRLPGVCPFRPEEFAPPGRVQ